MQPTCGQIPGQNPLGKAERTDGRAYESPALPPRNSATVAKLAERDPEREPPTQGRMTLAATDL